MVDVMRSLRDSASDAQRLSICFYIDDDDKETRDAIPDMKPEFADCFREVQYLVGQRIVHTHMYNHMCMFTNSDIIMYAADDIRFNTKGWDDVVLKTFAEVPDRVLLVWGKDPARIARGDPPFPDHGCVSRWSKHALKYLFPVFPPIPGMKGSIGCTYTDVWLKQLYQHLDRLKYLDSIEIAHKHWYVPTDDSDKAEFDDNYAIEAVLNDWRITPEFQQRCGEMPQHAALLQKFMKWVAEGGLDRVEPEVQKRLDWRANAKAKTGEKKLPSSIMALGAAVTDAKETPCKPSTAEEATGG